MSSSGVLQLLRSTADRPWISATSALDREEMLFCEVRRQCRDGEWSRYHVEVRESEGQRLVVRESEPRHLPVFCPERHINSDGTFCLGWEPIGPRLPATPEEARSWWAALRGYLRLQDAARTTRTWPADCAWPHGDAARFEWTLEKLLATLPASIKSALYTGPLRRSRRDPCPCGSGRRLKECSSHETDIGAVLWLSAERNRAEAAYWRSVSGMKCCGTMDGCKLSRASGTIAKRDP